MTTILKQLFKRFTPPMLRSDSPNRPMVVRRRHWLLQETRFLFLTRKGPVEIILKPSLIIGAGFVGVVGMTVIGAVTLFVGFKSVEVVRNESITAAIASAPPTLDDPDRTGSPRRALRGGPEDPIVEEAMPERETALAVASVPSFRNCPWPSTRCRPSRCPTGAASLPIVPCHYVIRSARQADNSAEPEDMISDSGPALLAKRDKRRQLASVEFSEPDAGCC